MGNFEEAINSYSEALALDLGSYYQCDNKSLKKQQLQREEGSDRKTLKSFKSQDNFFNEY